MEQLIGRVRSSVCQRSTNDFGRYELGEEQASDACRRELVNLLKVRGR